MNETDLPPLDPGKELASLAKRARVADFDLLIDKCRALYTILIAANRTVNLTRITSEEGFWLKHVADSLLLGAAFPDLVSRPLRVGDIGCGAGFPSLILAMAYPAWRVCAIDSVGKKTAFVASAAAGLALDNLEVITGRPREMGFQKIHQKSFDLLTARAVGKAPGIYGDARKLLADHGCWIFYKTPEQAAEELESFRSDPPPGPRLKWQLSRQETLPRDAGTRIFLHAKG